MIVPFRYRFNASFNEDTISVNGKSSIGLILKIFIRERLPVSNSGISRKLPSTKRIYGSFVLLSIQR